MNHTDHFFIITGGPGSGKSTLLEALADRGLHTMPESGRAIIQEQVARGGSALPWADRSAFAERMFQQEVHSWHAAHQREGPVMFDRGVPDVVGYLDLVGLDVPDHIEQAARTLRYAPRVFVAPHWPAIYANDGERKQTIEEAEATCRAVTRVYMRLGYEIILLPLASVAERVAFVRTAMASTSHRPTT
jgi:predicted ATPase